MASIQNISFFGATGGCAAACLARCLEAGYTCTALVRNADKLTKILSEHNISTSTISSHLTIITGDIKNPTDVSRALPPTTSIIISGIGAVPVRKPGDLLPSISDPTVCQVGMSTILSCLKSRPSATKPFLVAVSTTGISKYGRDYPIAVFPIYHWALKTPHKDKEAMEEMIVKGVEGADAALGEYAIVRASLLTSGPATTGKVRAEVEDGGVAKGAIGYTISRKDVGGYIFEEVVRKYEGPSGKGKIVSVSY